jgi:hypothetical protein
VADVLFDDARKLAQAEGTEIDGLVQAGLAKKSGENVQLLEAEERDKKSLGREVGGVYPLIHALQMTLKLWRRGEPEGIRAFLEEKGLGESETFWRVAQTLRDVLPEGTEEKKLLEQFLPTQERLARREAQPKLL